MVALRSKYNNCDHVQLLRQEMQGAKMLKGFREDIRHMRDSTNPDLGTEFISLLYDLFQA